MHRAEKPTITDDEQGRQMENLIALHQPAIAAGIHPAYAIDRQAHPRQLATRPPAAGTAYAGKNQQGNSGERQERVVGVEVRQFQFGKSASQG